MVVMNEHAIVDGKIGYSFLLEDLPFIRKDYCMVNTVIRRFKEIG